MEKKIAELVTADQVLNWLIVFFLVGYFIYKEWPELQRRLSMKFKKEYSEEAQDLSVEKRLDKIEAQLKEMNEKLARDYNRINGFDTSQQRIFQIIEGMLEEQGLITTALLGTLGGLQELGANGPTKRAKEEILEYLNKKAHKTNTKHIIEDDQDGG